MHSDRFTTKTQSISSQADFTLCLVVRMPAKERDTEAILSCEVCLPESCGLHESEAAIFQAYELLGHENYVLCSLYGFEDSGCPAPGPAAKMRTS